MTTKLINCHRCVGLSFENRKLLYEHLKSFHKSYDNRKSEKKVIKKKEQKFICCQCRKVFSRKKYLIAHLVRKQKLFRPECNICHNTFCDNKRLKEHKEKIHSLIEKN